MCLYPRMLIGRYALLGSLSANPIRFLGQYDIHSVPASRQCRGATAKTGSDDGEVRLELTCFSFAANRGRHGRFPTLLASAR